MPFSMTGSNRRDIAAALKHWHDKCYLHIVPEDRHGMFPCTSPHKRAIETLVTLDIGACGGYTLNLWFHLSTVFHPRNTRNRRVMDASIVGIGEGIAMHVSLDVTLPKRADGCNLHLGAALEDTPKMLCVCLINKTILILQKWKRV